MFFERMQELSEALQAWNARKSHRMPPSCAFNVILVYLYPYRLKNVRKAPKNAKLVSPNDRTPTKKGEIKLARVERNGTARLGMPLYPAGMIGIKGKMKAAISGGHVIFYYRVHLMPLYRLKYTALASLIRPIYIDSYPP